MTIKGFSTFVVSKNNPSPDNPNPTDQSKKLDGFLSSIKTGQRLIYTLNDTNDKLSLDIRNETALETISRNAHAFFTKIGLGKKAGNEHVTAALNPWMKDFPEVADLLALITKKNNQSAGFLKKSNYAFGIGPDSIRKYRENAASKARRTPPAMVPDNKKPAILGQLGTMKNSKTGELNALNGKPFAAYFKKEEDTPEQSNRYTKAFVDFAIAQAKGEKPELTSRDVYEFAHRWKDKSASPDFNPAFLQTQLRGCLDEISMMVDKLLAHEKELQAFKHDQLINTLENQGIL